MLTAAIPSVVCGMLTWIVVESEPANTIGVCQTENDAVLAAKAAFAKTSVATATVATTTVRKGPVMRVFLSFLIRLRGLQGFPEHVPEAVQIADEVRPPDREVVGRCRRERQSGQEEGIDLRELLGGVEEALPGRILARVLQRVHHRVGGHH